MQQRQLQHATASSTTLHVLPVDMTTHVEISNAAHSMWIATIDSDIANIQLEEFRKVFAGGIAVMVGGLVSTTLLGTIIEKKDLYANLAAESYLDMADDPEFWKQMSDGMSPEDQEKAKELMTKIKAKRAGDATAENNNNEEQPQVMASQGVESSTETETTTPAPVAAKYETAKASNDMFSDY